MYLECDGGGAGLRLVAAEGDPLLLEALLVLEVVLHVGQHHVTCRDVHLGRSVRGRVLATGVAAIQHTSDIKSPLHQRPYIGYPASDSKYRDKYLIDIRKRMEVQVGKQNIFDGGKHTG